ncbi:uncharacterized protein V6R79_016497 [Siganus canaliculatus]
MEKQKQVTGEEEEEEELFAEQLGAEVVGKKDTLQKKKKMFPIFKAVPSLNWKNDSDANHHAAQRSGHFLQKSVADQTQTEVLGVYAFPLILIKSLAHLAAAEPLLPDDDESNESNKHELRPIRTVRYSRDIEAMFNKEKEFRQSDREQLATVMKKDAVKSAVVSESVEKLRSMDQAVVCPDFYSYSSSLFPLMYMSHSLITAPCRLGTMRLTFLSSDRRDRANSSIWIGAAAVHRLRGVLC